MNTEVAKVPLVLPERLSAVEVGQGVLLLTASGFHKMLTDVASEKTHFETAIGHFNGELGAEARAILRGLFVTKSSGGNQ